MPAATSLTGSELLPIVQGGVNKSSTLGLLNNLYLALSGGTLTGSLTVPSIYSDSIYGTDFFEYISYDASGNVMIGDLSSVYSYTTLSLDQNAGVSVNMPYNNAGNGLTINAFSDGGSSTQSQVVWVSQTSGQIMGRLTDDSNGVVGTLHLCGNSTSGGFYGRIAEWDAVDLSLGGEKRVFTLHVERDGTTNDYWMGWNPAQSDGSGAFQDNVFSCWGTGVGHANGGCSINLDAVRPKNALDIGSSKGMVVGSSLAGSASAPTNGMEIQGLSKLDGGVVTGFIYPASNSITGFQFRKADGTTNILDVDSTNSRIGLLTAAPTHTLTLASVATGLAAYYTSDQTTNYTRWQQGWNGTTYQLGTFYGGSGSNASIQFGISTTAGSSFSTPNFGRALTMNFNQSTSMGCYDLSVNTSGNASAGTTIGGSSSSSSGFGAALGVFTTCNQSSTAGYRGLWITPYIQAKGSGGAFLIDAGTNSSALNGGTHTSKFTVDDSGNTKIQGLFYPQQDPTASAPSYVKGAIYFDTTLNKLRVGGATAWETVTSV